MALGTPVSGGTAYSAVNATSVSVNYPANIAANDVLVLVVGQRPNTANGGTLTDPSGWTRRQFHAGGGYGTTLLADEANTNLYFLTKDTVAGTETGSISLTLGDNNVSWAMIIRIPGGGRSSVGYATATGTRDTTPTSPLQVTMGSDPGFTSGDMAIFAMCVPTDAILNTFDAWGITQSGVTFATGVELDEPDTSIGLDLGGVVAYASCSSGTSTAAPRLDFTIAGGTLTNVRGPLIVLRVRDTTQALTPALFTNNQTFYGPTVGRGTITLTPAIYTNDQVFYTPTVTQSAAGQNLSPSLYTNDQTFYAPTVAATYSLTPDLYTNNQTFYSPLVEIAGGPQALAPDLYTNVQTFYDPTVVATYSLTPALFTNTQVFYDPTVATTYSLTPALYTNTQVFYDPTVATTYSLTPALFTNTQVFYDPTVSQNQELLPSLFTNTQTFYSPAVSSGQQNILPSLYTNTQTFYTPTVTATYSITFADYVDSDYVDPPGYVNWSSFNNQTFFTTTLLATYGLTPSLITNTHTFYAPTATATNTVVPSLYTNLQSFYSPTVTAPFIPQNRDVRRFLIQVSKGRSPVLVRDRRGLRTPRRIRIVN